MNISTVFRQFERFKVLVIGDVMLDAYTWGTVDRISPEAPVPIVSSYKREFRLGGAGNVALNLKALGMDPVLCGLIGKDDAGAQLCDICENVSIDASGLVKSQKRPTILKERVMGGDQQLLRIDTEDASETSPEEASEMKQKVTELLSNCDLVIFEDYDKGSINEEIITHTQRIAQSRNIPTAVDPKKRNFFSYRGVDLFKPNWKEFREGMNLQHPATAAGKLSRQAEQLIEKIGCKNLLLTLSAEGILIKSKKEEHRFPAHLRTISDVSGAGDTVISIAAACLPLKLPLPFIAELANLGGGLVCEQVGVVPINRNRLQEEAQALHHYLT